MIIKPMVRNNICLNSHPAGCAVSVRRQIDYVRNNLKRRYETEPRLALIIGCSNGYGLASRIGAAFGYKTATVGLSYEKAATENHTATPGYYNNMAFEHEAAKAGIVSRTLNGDAFTAGMKAETALALREAAAEAETPAKIDLIVYSLASPVRADPKTGVLYKSVIKPIGEAFSGKTIDIMDGTIYSAQAESATEEEIFGTVKVMGGEDLEIWIEAMDKERLIAPGTAVVAYTYIGPEHSWPIYKNGTIGRAKEDLERSIARINKTYADKGKIARAWVSVNKALVTRSSAVIPIIPLYISCLFRVMKDMGLHEGCIEQIVRLYRDRLYRCGSTEAENVNVDSEERIRIDDWEMRDDVQRAVTEKMMNVTGENISAETDIAGVRHDFLAANGFGAEGVDYEADADPKGIFR